MAAASSQVGGFQSCKVCSSSLCFSLNRNTPCPQIHLVFEPGISFCVYPQAEHWPLERSSSKSRKFKKAAYPQRGHAVTLVRDVIRGYLLLLAVMSGIHIADTRTTMESSDFPFRRDYANLF